MSQIQECPICIMKMNKTTRAPITCPDPQCGFSCCRSCTHEYIITQRNDPKCMSCSKAFSRMFMHTNMPAKWMKTTFIASRASILFEREKSLIPDTMPWVEAETTARGLQDEIATLHEQIKELQTKMAEIGNEIRARHQTIARLRDGELSKKSRTKKFIVKCPDCPAFVNKSGKCTSCGTRICIHCRDKLILEEGRDGTVDDIIIIDPPIPDDDADANADANADVNDDVERDPAIQYHVCDKSTLATARMIDTDTKPCPKCGNRIHKIEGCDQMFDPHCGTAFSWKTGQIVTGTIHNPHYFQWQRERGGAVARQPGDVLCVEDLQVCKMCTTRLDGLRLRMMLAKRFGLIYMAMVRVFYGRLARQLVMLKTKSLFTILKRGGRWGMRVGLCCTSKILSFHGWKLCGIIQRIDPDVYRIF